MAANNQGIYHLSTKKGGFPVCRNVRAHMSTDLDEFQKLPYDARCKRCNPHAYRWWAKRQQKMECTGA